MQDDVLTKLALEVGTLVREMQQRDEVTTESLGELVHSAVRSVPGADCGGLTIADRGNIVRTVAATDEYPVVLDRIQQQHGEGPCLSAAWEQHTVFVDDLGIDPRWPSYRRDAVAHTPIRSVMSFELFKVSKQLGALNFYAHRARAFDTAAVDVAHVYATHVAIAWTVVRRDNEFRSALASRDIIGQAKGMLMERFNIDAVHAFELLKRLSQDGNIPLAEVAQRLVQSDHPSR